MKLSLLGMSFLGDYQFLLDMSSTRLFDMMEVQLRFLLVEKYQREKHSRTIRRLKSKVNHVIKSAREGGKSQVSKGELECCEGTYQGVGYLGPCLV